MPLEIFCVRNTLRDRWTTESGPSTFRHHTPVDADVFAGHERRAWTGQKYGDMADLDWLADAVQRMYSPKISFNSSIDLSMPAAASVTKEVSMVPRLIASTRILSSAYSIASCRVSDRIPPLLAA